MRRFRNSLALIVGLALLWTAGGMHRELLEERTGQRTGAGGAPENAPPLVAFTTVVLGGFGGVLADILWLRTSYLQDDGKFVELVQLANWITRLEPYCGEVWSFHAWNMAYNVSALMPEPEDRWRWVRQGMNLLRDEGMRYNPRDPQLYFELAWLFENKVGSRIDDASPFFRRQWAEEMQTLLGGPQPDYAALEADPRRLKELRETYKLQPSVMKEVDRLYGPLDWRLSHAHAIYWAYRGRRFAGKRYEVQLDRLIYQPLAASFFNGRLVAGEGGQALSVQPNLDALPNVIRTFEESLARYGAEGTLHAYSNFLSQATVTLVQNGREADAASTFERYRARFPAPTGPADLDSFVKAVEADMAKRRPRHEVTP